VIFAKGHYGVVNFRTHQSRALGGAFNRFGDGADVPEGLAGAELPVIRSLISSLIHPRTPKSIGMYRWSKRL
jgi:hypothetical protein